MQGVFIRDHLHFKRHQHGLIKHIDIFGRNLAMKLTYQ